MFARTNRPGFWTAPPHRRSNLQALFRATLHVSKRPMSATTGGAWERLNNGWAGSTMYAWFHHSLCRPTSPVSEGEGVGVGVRGYLKVGENPPVRPGQLF